MSLQLIGIKTSNPDVVLIAYKDEIKFVGNYAVVRAIAKKNNKNDSAPYYVYGVINKNFEEVSFDEKSTDTGSIECQYLKFSKSNKKIYGFDGNDFITQVVIKTDYCDLIEYKHIKVIDDNRVKVISENIGEDLSKPKIYKNMFLADNFVYDVINAKVLYNNHDIYDNFGYQSPNDIKILKRK